MSGKKPGAPARHSGAPQRGEPGTASAPDVALRQPRIKSGGDASLRQPEPVEGRKMPARALALQEDAPFWRTKTLAQMTHAEWESLCDGCGKCCVISLEDADTGELYRTDVACNLFNTVACGCGDYANRKKRVPDCVQLTPKNVPKLDWLPPTCAYRLVSEGRDLSWWHPLVSGDPETVHIAQASVRGQTRPEGRLKTPGLMKRIKQWPEPLEAPPAKASRKR